MKKIIIVLCLSVFLTSCETTEYVYQVVEINSTDAKLQEKKLFYDNNELLVNYLLWNEGGNLVFTVYNKTDSPIFVDLNRCHFIKNDESFDYYSESETTESHTGATELHGVRGKYISQTGVSVKSKTKQIVEIPPKSYIKFDQFVIMDRYKDCELRKYERGKVAFISFAEKDSPVIFRVYITYSSSISFDNVKTVDNSFWITKISNMFEKEFKGTDTHTELPKCKPYDPRNIIHTYEYPFLNQNSFFSSTLLTIHTSDKRILCLSGIYGFADIEFGKIKDGCQ